MHQQVDRQVDLANQNSLAQSPGAIAVCDCTHLGGDPVHLGLVCRMQLKQAVHFTHSGLIGWVGRIVPEVCCLQEVPQHVDPESIDATVEPEPHHIVHRRLYGWIAPVEVWLLLQEGMVVVLFGCPVPFPG